jgi:hypothetical protein
MTVARSPQAREYVESTPPDWSPASIRRGRPWKGYGAAGLPDDHARLQITASARRFRGHTAASVEGDQHTCGDGVKWGYQ